MPSAYAVTTVKIAAGDIDEQRDDLKSAAAHLGVSPQRRAEIAKNAAAKRWGAKPNSNEWRAKRDLRVSRNIYPRRPRFP
jgi:hypothetical protein